MVGTPIYHVLQMKQNLTWHSTHTILWGKWEWFSSKQLGRIRRAEKVFKTNQIIRRFWWWQSTLAETIPANSIWIPWAWEYGSIPEVPTARDWRRGGGGEVLLPALPWHATIFVQSHRESFCKTCRAEEANPLSIHQRGGASSIMVAPGQKSSAQRTRSPVKTW